MTYARVRTNGSDNWQTVRTGYQYQSKQWAVLVRESPFQRFLNAWSETPWFERSLCFYMIAGTVGAIIYSFTGA